MLKLMVFRSADLKKQERKPKENKRLLWKMHEIPDEGVPFTVDRTIIRSCQYGKPHKRPAKQEIKVGIAL